MPPASPTAEADHAQARREVAKLAESARRELGLARAESALGTADQMLALLPESRTALFRADILRDLGRLCEAFEAVLLARDLKPTERESLEISQKLARYGPRCGAGMGWATFRVSPAGASEEAEIVISAAPVPRARTVGLGAGSHELRIGAPGFRTERTTLVVRAGEGAVARFELRPLPVDQPPAPAEPAVPDKAVVAAQTHTEAPSSEPLAWYLVGGGAVLAAAGAAFHVEALSAASDADDLLREAVVVRDEQPVGWVEEYDDLRDRHGGAISDVRTRQTVAFVLYGAAAAAAAVGAVMLVARGHDEPAAFDLLPAMSPAGPGLVLSGGF